VFPHPTIDATLVRLASEIPAKLIEDGIITPIAVDAENALLNIAKADTVSWGTASSDANAPIPRLLQSGSVFLLSPSACRARVGGEGVVFQNEWICISDASVQKVKKKIFFSSIFSLFFKISFLSSKSFA
jgi:hypothetical protein